MNFTDDSTAPGAAKGIPAPEKVRRILVCQLRQIGDVLLATPSIELLGRHYPHAEIDVFTEKKCVPMLENNPYIHKIIPLDKNALKGALAQLNFYRRLGRSPYDILVNFQHLPRCTWLAVFSNIKPRLASNSVWYAKFLYTHTATMPPGYAAQRKAGVLAPLGITWRGERPRLYLNESERAAAGEVLREMGLLGKRFISVDSTHFDSARLWPRPYYAALIDMLAQARPELHFMLSYGPGEDWQVKELFELCRHKERVAMFPRVLPLRHAAACMERAAMHLGNCSSPRHMAVALDVPSLVMIGATDPTWTFPSPEHSYIRLADLKPLESLLAGGETLTPQDYYMTCLKYLTPNMVFPRALAHLDDYAKP